VSILRFFLLGVSPKTFSMARPTNNHLGFTLLELLTVVLITAILAAIALPYLSNKVFARTVPKIESTLKVVSLKARANAGNPYRVTLQGTAPAAQLLRVDYIINGNCNTPAAAVGWRQDPVQTLELPSDIAVINFPSGGFCFDGTGQATSLPVTEPASFTVRALKQTSLAARAVIAVSLIGEVDLTTFDQNNNNLNGKL
jgi:prepilin-type N-terminal cleavage/methylation domain-containing protein